MDLCKNCNSSSIKNSCKDCLEAPNLHVGDSLEPCGGTHKVCFENTYSDLCKSVPTLSVISNTPNVSYILGIDYIEITSLTENPNEEYEIIYELKCLPYSTSASITGITKDLCYLQTNCDPCTGDQLVVTPNVLTASPDILGDNNIGEVFTYDVSQNDTVVCDAPDFSVVPGSQNNVIVSNVGEIFSITPISVGSFGFQYQLCCGFNCVTTTVTGEGISDILPVVLDEDMCGEMYVVSSEGDLISYDPINDTESVICTGLLINGFRPSDIALLPNGDLYASNSGLLYRVDKTDCSVESTGYSATGAGLTYFTDYFLMHGEINFSSDSLLDIYTTDVNNGTTVLWADTDLPNLNPSGDFILLGTVIYVTLRNISTGDIFLYSFDLNPDNTWAGTYTNLGLLPLGNNKYWGLAQVGGSIYAVDGLDIVLLDLDDPQNSSVLHTITNSTTDLTGAASIEDGLIKC